jgi:hypothetical protein
MLLYELRSSKRSKPSCDSKSASTRGELFIIARLITNLLEITIEVEDNKDITRLV